MIKLTPRSYERLEENDPVYKFVDYFIEIDGVTRIRTMTVEEYKALIADL